MRTISKLGLVALVAAVTVLPTFNTPASARSIFRSFQRIYTPSYYANGYGYTRMSANDIQALQRTQAANAFTAQVEAMVRSGQLTPSEGNVILVRGHF